MKRISLKICMGTMCYVLGGAELKDTLENLPEEINNYLDITYSPCLGYCQENEPAPFIELNGRKIAGVCKQSLIQILKEELRHVI